MVLDVVIVNYNSGARLSSCLEALFRQGPNLRVHVFDNASSDTSLDKAVQRYPAIAVTRSQKNLGFAPAVNRVMAEIDGEFALLVNPDLIILPGAIHRLAAFMRENPRCAIVGGEIVDPRGRFQPTCRRFPNYYNVLFGRRSLLRRLFPGNRVSRSYLYLDLDTSRPQRVDFVEGSLVMIRMPAWREVGGFDNDFFLYLEDADLCRRLCQTGWETWWLPRAYGIHFRGETFRTDNIRPRIHHSCGYVRYLSKHTARAPGGLLWWLLGLRVTYLAATGFLTERQR